MAKTRKTRKQKKLADLRHSPLTVRSVTKSSPPSEYTLETSLSASFPVRVKADQSSGIISIEDIRYIKKDLIKISVLTVSIVIAELALSYALTAWR